MGTSESKERKTQQNLFVLRNSITRFSKNDESTIAKMMNDFNYQEDYLSTLVQEEMNQITSDLRSKLST